MKPTTIEHSQRIDKVYELLTAGLRRGQIMQYVADKTDWGSAERTIDGYIAKATARFAELADVDRAAQAGRALARLDELYARSLKIQDYKTCLNIEKERIRLLGIDRKWPAKAAM